MGRNVDSDFSRRLVDVVGFTTTIVVFVLIAIGRLGNTSLWVDEAWSLAAVDHLGMSLRSTGATMGAYYVILWLWSRVSTAPWWMRLLSLIFGVATLFVVRAIGRRLGGRRLAIFAPILLVTSPIFLWISTEARGYSLEILVVSGAWYCALRAIDARKRPGDSSEWRWWIALAALATFGPLVHGLFFISFAGICALCLFDSNLGRSILRLLPAALGTFTVTGLLWVLSRNSTGADQAGNFYQLTTSVTKWFVSPAFRLDVALVTLVVAGSIAAVVAATNATSAPQRMLLVAPTLWVWAPVFVSIFVRDTYGTFTVYYLSPLTPGIALLTGSTVLAVFDRLGNHTFGVRRVRIVTAALGCFLVAVLCSGQIRSHMQPHENWRGAARIVAADGRPTDAVIFGGDFLHHQGAARAAFEAAWRDVPHRRGPISIAPTRPLGEVQRVDHYPSIVDIRKRAARATRVWVIDYQQQMLAINLTDRAPFTTEFTPVINRRLSGGVDVTLYIRAARRLT